MALTISANHFTFRAHVKNRRVGIGNPSVRRRSQAAPSWYAAFSMVGRSGATSVAPFLRAVFPILFVQPPVRLETPVVGFGKLNRRRFIMAQSNFNETINQLDEAIFSAQGCVEILSLIRDENLDLIKRSPSADAFFSAKEALKRFLNDADTYSSQLRNDLEDKELA